MKLVPFFLLLTGLVLTGESILETVIHRYDLNMTQVSWTVAQEYCRVMYTDLATVVSDDDWLELTNKAASKGLIGSAWIGLYKDLNWYWTLNDIPLKSVGFTSWALGEPNDNFGDTPCAITGWTNAWWAATCTDLRPFICYNANFSGSDKFIGINTRMGFPQALNYCRTHHTDLAISRNSAEQNILGQIYNIQLESWIGLYRYTWKWSDGTIARNVPWAPGQPDNKVKPENCAMVTNGLVHDERCTNLTYFYCHRILFRRSQTVRLQVKSDGRVFDPVVQSAILKQMKQKLEDKGMLNTTVTWRMMPDGNIFHKKKDEL